MECTTTAIGSALASLPGRTSVLARIGTRGAPCGRAAGSVTRVGAAPDADVTHGAARAGAGSRAGGVACANMLPVMCSSIRTLFNFDPPATDEEVRAASLQFVRKLSGFTRPSRANEAAFERAVDEVAAVARRLIDSLETSAPPKDRVAEAARARECRGRRFGAAR